MVSDGFSVHPTDDTVADLAGAGSGLTLCSLPLVRRLGSECDEAGALGAAGGLEFHSPQDDRGADGEGAGDGGGGRRAASEVDGSDLVQLMRVLVVSPDASSGLVVLRSGCV